MHIDHKSPKALGAGLWLTFVCGICGCGGSGALSQSDLKRYAFNRSSGDTESETTHVAAPSSPAASASPTGGAGDTAAAAHVGENVRPTSEQATNQADTVTLPAADSVSASDATSASGSAEIQSDAKPEPDRSSGEETLASLQPIELRRPTEQFTDAARRQRALENIEQVTDALVQWIEQSSAVPASRLVNSKNRPVLSWRVQILPLLGYDELYRRFDLEQPWDSPHNKALLPYIPDEFVSPERFDESTNLQLLINGQAMFTDSIRRDKSELSDAPNILMLVEVDDELAVPWTAPFDYDVTAEPLGKGLGNLREDGVFCSWLSGVVSVWPKPVNAQVLNMAITFEAGERFPLANYQRYPKFNLASPERPQTTVSSTELEGTPTSVADRSFNPWRATASGSYTRLAMPERDAIMLAEQKIRETYLAEFERAKTTVELLQLAKKIMNQLTAGDSPAAELYVGLRTALKIAIRAGDPHYANDIADDIQTRFEVDQSELDETIVDGFLEGQGRSQRGVTQSAQLLLRAERLVEADIAQDDFRSAERRLEQVRGALRANSDRELQYRWRVLGERVSEGKRLYNLLSKHLEISPQSPQAKRTFGWYLCLIKQNWAEGLEMLADSDDSELRELAQFERFANEQVSSHLKMADAWWDYAHANQRDELTFHAALKRARKWYSSASLALPDGLDRIRAHNRLQAIQRLIGNSSLASVDIDGSR